MVMGYAYGYNGRISRESISLFLSLSFADRGTLSPHLNTAATSWRRNTQIVKYVTRTQAPYTQHTSFHLGHR